VGRDQDSSRADRRQRMAARTVFGATLAVLLAVGGLPLGLSLAQVTPTIQIINPHADTSLEVSEKGQPYHLNSWVGTLPPQPLVEYELDVTTAIGPGAPTTETRTLGTAVQEGNTFSLLWDIEDDIRDEPAPPNTSLTYELRAILYTGFSGPGTGVEVSRDETPITVNHQAGNPPAQAPSETVELTYPANGGQLGVFIRPDGSGGNFTLDANISEGTNYVKFFYTISEVGEDPEWTSCDDADGYSGFVGGETTVRLRCATQAGHYALDITGVALVANDTPDEGFEFPDATFDESGDAHAVTPYFQRVSSLTLDPTSTGDQARAQCVQYVATAIDQQSRPIGNMNIDAMAQGPSDQLKFDAFTGNGRVSDNNQVPDEGHDADEPAISCSGGNRGGNTGRQGEHNVPGGNDIKHIESAGGTDLNGEFEFALATDRDGETQVMAYADERDDDLFCGQEKSANASIGWGGPAPGAAGFAAESDNCTVGTPSPTPTPTESPTDSPTDSPTEEPKEKHSRDVTIGFAHGSLIVSGKVSVDDGTNKCRQNVSVQVQRRQDKKWKTKKTVETNGSGNYSASIKDKPGKYRARAVKVRKGNDVCLLTTAVKRHRH
jgi:hypothetical protein